MFSLWICDIGSRNELGFLVIFSGQLEIMAGMQERRRISSCISFLDMSEKSPATDPHSRFFPQHIIYTRSLEIRHSLGLRLVNKLQSVRLLRSARCFNVRRLWWKTLLVRGQGKLSCRWCGF